ncbi:protease HtpX [Oxalobacter vibrioformis]|uniref:Protease HtpX homolog n=1 Tax=Oxalobacter vibrioformis TaxID=933080 RepID=A0A9E9LYV3_9BURK|nr:protease HtpX [Oxalobacter vibrioformis]WAW11267.1 protease HtpX [Oxalobacter vibrioformis]
MMRVILFLVTNLAVMLVASIVLSLLGAGRYMTAQGIDYYSLFVFALVFGFTGSFISLFLSKFLAKRSTRAHVITSPANETERWLVSTVEKLATTAGIGMPEVAVYEGEPNAFATGAFKNSALVAVSTGLLQSMSHEEVEAVLAHEVAHIANGDMVTMTLLQGVVNTFVIFLARVVGFVVDKAISRDSDSEGGAGYYITVIVCEIAFGVLASIIVAWFSRRREYRADAGSVKLMGRRQPMIHALQRLGGIESGDLPKNLVTAGITSSNKFLALFRSHPPIEKRIETLQNNVV